MFLRNQTKKPRCTKICVKQRQRSTRNIGNPETRIVKRADLCSTLYMLVAAMVMIFVGSGGDSKCGEGGCRDDGGGGRYYVMV